MFLYLIYTFGEWTWHTKRSHAEAAIKFDIPVKVFAYGKCGGTLVEQPNGDLIRE